MDQKIWNLTDTGVVFHVFKEDGTAQCRKTTKVAPYRQPDTESHVDRIAAQPLGYRKCASCAKKEAAFRDRAEASMQPSDGEGDCLPPAEAAPVKRAPRVIDPKPVGSVVIDAPACTCPVLERKYYGGDKPHHPCCALSEGEPCGVRLLDFRSSRFIYCTKPKGHDKAHGRHVVTEDAPAHNPAPACTCTNHPGFQKHGYHLATCPTDSKENDDVTIKDGPLTERQIFIINRLRAGKRHEEIAKSWATVPGGGEEPRTITVSVVKQECQIITAKFGTATVTQAVSLWATAQAYRETATLIGSHRPSHVDDETDVHVDHVLYGLMQILRERADRLTPQ